MADFNSTESKHPSPAFLAAVDRLEAKADLPRIREQLAGGNVEGAIETAREAAGTFLNRRALIGGAATIAAGAVAVAASVPAAATEPDPVFEAIERYKRAHAYYGKCLDRQEEIVAPIFEQKREAYAAIDTYRSEVLAQITKSEALTDDEVIELVKWKAHEIIEEENKAAQDEADRLFLDEGEVFVAAINDVYRTVPTTAAGAAELIRFVTEEVETQDWDDDALPVLASLQTFLRGAAGMES